VSGTGHQQRPSRFVRFEHKELLSVLGKIFGGRGDSADRQSEQQSAAVVTPVETTTESGEPTIEWATLGRVPVAQCVPAAPTFEPYDGQLSPVSAETVARLTKQ
jgi:hypothetical protein